MALGTLLLTASLLTPGARGNDWIPLDDPDLARLPVAFRALPASDQEAYESASRPWYLVARTVEGEGEIVDAFIADEESIGAFSELIPVGEDYFEVEGGEAILFHCEWSDPATPRASARVAALYAPNLEGGVVGLWLVAPLDTDPELLTAELEALLPGMQRSIAPGAGDVYRSLLRGHRVSFSLRPGGLASGDADGIVLTPVDQTTARDREFFDAIHKVNQQFEVGIPRNWRDDARGVSLSLQIIQTDTGFGPEDPFVVWLAGQLQTFVRVEKDAGDAPIGLVHLEGARTNIVTPAQIQRHYAANRRAPEAGVILKTYLPLSPFARVCRLRWLDAESKDKPAATEEETPPAEPAPPAPSTPEASAPPVAAAEPKVPLPSLAVLVELRDYVRSRSETVVRTCVVLLLARAENPNDLALLYDGLALTSHPPEGPPPLAALPR